MTNPLYTKALELAGQIPSNATWIELCDCLEPLDTHQPGDDLDTFIDDLNRALEHWPDTLRYGNTGNYDHISRHPEYDNHRSWWSYEQGWGLTRPAHHPAVSIFRNLGIFIQAIDDDYQIAVQLLDDPCSRSLTHLLIVSPEKFLFDEPIISALATSPHARNVTHVYLDNCILYEEPLIQLMDQHPNFTSLTVRNQSTSYPLLLMLQHPNAAQLTSFSCHHAQCLANCFHELTHLTSLKHLELTNTLSELCTTRAFKDLAQAPHMQALETIDFSHSDITDTTLDTILTHCDHTTWRRLILDDNAITDDSARMLAQDPDLANLEVLSLDNTRITNVGAAYLSTSPYLCAAIRETFDVPGLEIIMTHALSLIAGDPDSRAFGHLTRYMDEAIQRLTPHETQTLIDALNQALEHWPDTLRWAPVRWWAALQPGQPFPRIQITRAIDIHGDVEPIGEFTIERVVNHPDVRDITWLGITQSNKNMMGWRFLETAQSLQNLKTLILGEFDGYSDTYAAQFFQRTSMPRLEHLHFYYCDVSDQTIEMIVNSPFSLELKTLAIRGSNCTKSCAEILINCPNLNELTHLELVVYGENDIIKKRLKDAPALAHLHTLTTS